MSEVEAVYLVDRLEIGVKVGGASTYWRQGLKSSWRTTVSKIDDIKAKMNVNYTIMFQKMKVSHGKQIMVAKEQIETGIKTECHEVIDDLKMILEDLARSYQNPFKKCKENENK